MFKRKDFALIILLLVFSVFPLISFAQWLPTGPACSPEDDFNPTHTQTCQYKKVGTDKPREVRLKWNITPKGSGPQFCALGCTQSGGTSCTGAMFKDNNGFAAGAPGSKLYAKDDIKINDKSLEVGNTYQALCCAMTDPATREGNIFDQFMNMCQPGTIAYSQKMVITDSTPCELPFSTILDGLTKGTKVTITEENFSGWTSPDLKDNVTLSLGLGSGDKIDVLKVMDGLQSCQRLPNPTDPDYYNVKMTNYDKVISTIKSSVDNHDPIMIGIVTKKADIGHALLALSLSTSGATTTIEVFDSNSPEGTTSLICGKEKDLIPGQGYYYFLSCKLLARKTDYRVFIPLTLNSQRLDCGVGKRVRPKPTGWIGFRGNNPSFENPTTTANTKGICYGYSEFVRDVACFGDFPNEDFHPNDGKIVGRDCDASHNLIVAEGPKSGRPNNFVASVSSVGELFLRRLGSIFDI